MVTEEQLQNWVKGTIKGELAKNGMTYADLCELLKLLGIEENERNLRNKIARGTFSATFFLVCLQAIGSRNLYIDIIPRADWVRFQDALDPERHEREAEFEATLKQIRGIMES